MKTGEHEEPTQRKRRRENGTYRMPSVNPDLHRLASGDIDDIDLNLERYTRLALGDVLTDELPLRRGVVNIGDEAKRRSGNVPGYGKDPE